MNPGSPRIHIVLLAVLAVSFCKASSAQPDTPPAGPRDPLPTPTPADTPALRAARLTFVAGAVRVQRSDNTGDDTAVLNMPLGEGTRILTGDYGQAEIEFEDGSVARITPRSALAINLLALDSAHIAHTELTLLGGLAYFQLRKSPGYTWLVDAGGIRLTPLENLSMRLNLDEPPAVFAVLTGSAHIERSGAFETDVHSGETLRADAGDSARYSLTPQLAQESWDSWNESRDRAAADASDKRTAARNEYAGAQGYGWSDLDSNGNWYSVPGAGEVWQPDNADEGFDPYGYGAWVWGNGAYVWASAYSWGWTPFRCGHWQYFSGFGWGWMPDPYCAQWGFAGGGYLGESGRSGVFVRGPYPPRHNPVIGPLPRPGNPVVPVRGPDGPRPWTPHGGLVKIAGAPATPLPALGSGSSWSGSAGGKALAMDFPVDRKTHQPILGAVPASPSSPMVYSNTAPSSPKLMPGTRSPHPPDGSGVAPASGSSVAPASGTSWRRNPFPAQETGSDPIPTQRQGSGAPPLATPRPSSAPGSEPRPAPVAPVHSPSATAPLSRPAPPPPSAPPASHPAPAAAPPPSPQKPKA